MRKLSLIVVSSAKMVGEVTLTVVGPNLLESLGLDKVVSFLVEAVSFLVD